MCHNIIIITLYKATEVLAGWLLVQGRWSHSKITWGLWMSDRTQKQATAKVTWETISTDTCQKC